ncbi:response regulator [Pseudomonas sp. NY15437]|uniref:response regulator n=1 Tax=unclassified Pseudomonas TaxID=196821 RepID=UPI00223C4858|nr:response regulator [Pseudomonas sp. GCEP-101]
MARPRHVVLVEDDAIMQMLLVDLLQELTDGSVHPFAKGEDAIAFLRQHPEIDLLITDVNLAGETSGIEVARFATESIPALPVVVTSAIHWHRRGIPPSATFLTKPFTVEAFDRMIRGLMQG